LPKKLKIITSFTGAEEKTKSNMKRFVFILILLSLSGCDLFVSSPRVSTRNFLFEVEYENFAWGYVHRGIYINNKGEVYKYDYDSSSGIWRRNDDGLYTESELIKKYRPNNEFLKKLDVNRVSQMRDLIPEAMQAGYSDTVSVGADIGAVNYICYSYDKSAHKYFEIILAQEGDWKFKKESAAADTLINWLKKIL